jgi:hypothetical protein
VPRHLASGSGRWLLAAAAEINMAASRVGHLQRVAAPRKAKATGRLSGEGVAAHLAQRDDGRAHAVRNENGRIPVQRGTRWSGRRLAAGWPAQRRRRWWQGGVSGRSPCAGLPPAALNDALMYCGCSCSAEARRRDAHLHLHSTAGHISARRPRQQSAARGARALTSHAWSSLRGPIGCAMAAARSPDRSGWPQRALGRGRLAQAPWRLR